MMNTEPMKTPPNRIIPQPFLEIDPENLEGRDIEHTRETQCPQCGSEHETTKLLGVDVTQCKACHGIFLNEEQIKAIQDLSAGQASS